MERSCRSTVAPVAVANFNTASSSMQEPIEQSYLSEGEIVSIKCGIMKKVGIYTCDLRIKFHTSLIIPPASRVKLRC